MLGKSSCPLQGVHVRGRAKGVALIANTTQVRCIHCLKHHQLHALHLLMAMTRGYIFGR